MAAQEDKRKKMSHDLRDEIAQTLLGINVRLLTLKMDASNATSIWLSRSSSSAVVTKDLCV